MTASLFRCRWVKYWCHPICVCGWTGEPSLNIKVARAVHKRHVREDCPIGDRRARH